MWLREKGRAKPWVKEEGEEIPLHGVGSEGMLGGFRIPLGSALVPVVNKAVSSWSCWDCCPWAARSGHRPTGILDTSTKK